MRASGVLAAVLACGLLFVDAATAAPERPDELHRRLEAIPGMTVQRERPTQEGFRFFELTYRQPADHRDPRGQSFPQRLTLLHRGFDRPTVAHTTGYYLPDVHHRSEPAQLLDANQLNIEYRFFEPSRPRPAHWPDLTLWQGASDQHRAINAVRGLYPANWISTGQSKGGMSAVYHRRFYPDDVDGTVAYVAPNDVHNDADGAYDEFFGTVGTQRCRDALAGLQRAVLHRRDEMLPRYADYARRNDLTFERMPGGMDQALEATVLDTAFAFWQYQGQQRCGTVPAPDAPSSTIFDFVEDTVGFDSYADQGLDYYLPYYFQSASELGWPSMSHSHLDELLRHDHERGPSSYLPEQIPVSFRERAMREIDDWVRTGGSELMFVNGSADPWSAEPFRLGPGTRDSAVHVVPGGNHGAEISQLPLGEREAAISAVRRWGGLGSEHSMRPPTHISGLDDRPIPRTHRP